MSLDRPPVVLVHGAWHGAWCWERVVPLLEARGLGVETLTLPSIDAPADDDSGVSGDAAAVRALLDRSRGASVLVAHSYGGMVMTAAAAGRTDVGRLLYLCAFMPEPGQSLNDITGGPAPWIRETADGRALPDLDLAPATFYADCDEATQRSSTARLRPMPLAPFAEPAAEVAWRSVPSTYVVCAQDGALPPPLQRDVFAPRAEETVELDASHSPFLSQPQVLAQLIADRAGS